MFSVVISSLASAKGRLHAIAIRIVEIGYDNTRAVLRKLLHGCFADARTTTCHCEDSAEERLAAHHVGVDPRLLLVPVGVAERAARYRLPG